MAEFFHSFKINVVVEQKDRPTRFYQGLRLSTQNLVSTWRESFSCFGEWVVKSINVDTVYKKLFEGKSIHNKVYYSDLDHILPVDKINPVNSLNIKLVAFEDEADQVTNPHEEIVFSAPITFKSANKGPMCAILLHVKDHPIPYMEEEVDTDGDQDSDKDEGADEDEDKDEDEESVSELIFATDHLRIDNSGPSPYTSTSGLQPGSSRSRRPATTELSTATRTLHCNQLAELGFPIIADLLRTRRNLNMVENTTLTHVLNEAEEHYRMSQLKDSETYPEADFIHRVMNDLNRVGLRKQYRQEQLARIGKYLEENDSIRSRLEAMTSLQEGSLSGLTKTISDEVRD